MFLFIVRHWAAVRLSQDSLSCACFFFCQFGCLFVCSACFCLSHGLWLFNSHMFCSLSCFPCIFILCMSSFIFSKSGKDPGTILCDKVEEIRSVLSQHYLMQFLCGSSSAQNWVTYQALFTARRHHQFMWGPFLLPSIFPFHPSLLFLISFSCGSYLFHIFS